MRESGKVAAIIVAAGRGERAGRPGDGPKQYRAIAGRPIIRHTLETFAAHEAIGAIVVAIHPDDHALFKAAAGDLARRVSIVHGGPSRQESVLHGLSSLEVQAPEVVLIHDAVRPFADRELIDRVIAAVDAGTGALPALAVADTLKKASGGLIGVTVDRSGLFAAQTPQGFPFAAILAAHRRAVRHDPKRFTDDASIAEWAGLVVRIVEGSSENTKLTLAQDIAAADRRMRGASGMIDVRTGHGYDVHQLVPGDHVTLCGVRIVHDMTLLGHSDADVGLHALTDALLATCGEGDIGTHFPPSDPQWKGAPSHIFVRKAVEIVKAKGGRIANADISLICEAPKIAPHREEMRRAVAEMTGLALERVSIKATTNETIGFVGRKEGIAALATASVVYGGG